MTYKLNDQEVEIVDTHYDGQMAQVIEAYYIDSEEALTEDECIELEERFQDELVASELGRRIDQAHDYMDLER